MGAGTALLRLGSSTVIKTSLFQGGVEKSRGFLFVFFA